MHLKNSIPAILCKLGTTGVNAHNLSFTVDDLTALFCMDVILISQFICNMYGQRSYVPVHCIFIN